MYIEQLYTNCLAQASYYIESEGEAVIIDPLRDTAAYIQKAEERNAKIRYIFETHFHADFVSGHLDLAKATGASIVFGPLAVTSFEKYEARDGEVLPLGNISFEVLHTPGHTPESTCYLLRDEKGAPHALFSGDTLFVGDVGRPDLLDGTVTKEELAGMMYNSLHSKLKKLPDEVILYPAHGPGSSCGKNLGPETYSTLGVQKKTNYALQEMSKEEFIRQVTDGIQPPPSYFFADAKLNKSGYLSLEEVISKGNLSLALAPFEQAVKSGALVLDTRKPDDFELGFIPGALNIGLNGQFAIWAGTLIDIQKPLVLICDAGKEEEAIMRLARVGFDNIQGYLQGGMESWRAAGKRTDMIISIEPEEFALDYNHSEMEILDVRKPGEYETAHVKKAELLTLQELPKDLHKLDKGTTYYVHCAGGYRSMIAASLLKANGFSNVKNVYGGFGKIKETGIPVVASKAQSSS